MESVLFVVEVVIKKWQFREVVDNIFGGKDD